jgi:SAM-dependent methyltransferase
MTNVAIGSSTPWDPMTLDRAPWDLTPPDLVPWDEGCFGSGAQEPYDRALLRGGGVLSLRDASHGTAKTHTRIDVRRFLDDASEPERRLVRQLDGPILDVGCGPGRLVKAAILAGRPALGIDTSPAATGLARAAGLPVLRRSVFHPLPNEGEWGAALLIDGNVGIGGEPDVLLQRCARLVRPGGRIVVEAHDDPARDRSFRGIIADRHGRSSLPFPWAEVGTVALHRHAQQAGLTLVREWNERRRSFAEYAPR